MRRADLALAALVLGAYAYFYQAGGWNQNVRFDLVRAIVERGESRIDAYAKNTGDLAKRGKHLYCDKAPGLSWMAVPAYGAMQTVASSAKPSPDYLAWGAWLATVTAVAVPSAIAAVFLAMLLRAWGVRAGPAWGAAAAWSLATLAWPYGTLFYGHQTAAALLAIGFALVAIPRARGELAGIPRMIAVGAILGWAVVVEYPAALAAAVIGAYAIWAHGWKRALWIAAGAAPPAIAIAAYHWVLFGSPFTTAYEFSTQKNRSQGVFMGIGAPRLEAFWHLLFSDYRGLFFSAPWLLLAIPGGFRLARARRGPEVAVCATIAALFLWLNVSLPDWQGGWAMGARYLVPCLPFVALLAGGIVRGPLHRGVAAAALALVVYSGFAMLVATSVKPEVNVKEREPFQDFLYPRFFRGELAVSTQGIDMRGEGPRDRRQAWNLGETLGLGGLASLVPLVLWCGALGAVLVARSRARDRP
jgi:hypothetical protein